MPVVLRSIGGYRCYLALEGSQLRRTFMRQLVGGNRYPLPLVPAE